MKDIFMFCDDSYDCNCEDFCCQECKRDKPEDYKQCDNHCKNIKFKEEVYAGEQDNKLVSMLEEVAESSDKWLAVAGVERFKDLLKIEDEINKLRVKLKHWKDKKMSTEFIAKEIKEILEGDY